MQNYSKKIATIISPTQHKKPTTYIFVTWTLPMPHERLLALSKPRQGLLSLQAPLCTRKGGFCLLLKPPRGAVNEKKLHSPKQVRLAAIVPCGAFFAIFKAADYIL